MNEIQTLFPELAQSPGQSCDTAQTPTKVVAPARVLMPNRTQMQLHPSNLESLLPEGHRARFVWGYVVRQDLSGLYAKIKAREGGAGRSAIAPEILFALWLYGTLEGVGSARALAKLTLEHDAYRWICGGCQVNCHTLSDFRVDHAQEFDELLSENIAALMVAGVVKLKCVAQDGVRVRASAGAASFRREDKLKDCLGQAQAEVQRLKNQIQDDPAAVNRKSKAATERAAREREQRIEEALKRLPEIRETKQRQGKKPEEARASTTDAQDSVMKMGDGGFRPAYNTQYAADCESQIIVGVDVVTSGTDMGQLTAMVKQVQERCGQAPEQWLVDAGYPKHDQIDEVAQLTTVYAPVPKLKKEWQDEHAPRASDSEAVAQWRQRMTSDEAKELYKKRAATAECVNAQARNRGLVLLPIRGLSKVKCVATFVGIINSVVSPLWLGFQANC